MNFRKWCPKTNIPSVDEEISIWLFNEKEGNGLLAMTNNNDQKRVTDKSKTNKFQQAAIKTKHHLKPNYDNDIYKSETVKE